MKRYRRTCCIHGQDCDKQVEVPKSLLKVLFGDDWIKLLDRVFKLGFFEELWCVGQVMDAASYPQ